jgi:hypothetical protein
VQRQHLPEVEARRRRLQRQQRRQQHRPPVSSTKDAAIWVTAKAAQPPVRTEA